MKLSLKDKNIKLFKKNKPNEPNLNGDSTTSTKDKCAIDGELTPGEAYYYQKLFEKEQSEKKLRQRKHKISLLIRVLTFLVIIVGALIYSSIAKAAAGFQNSYIDPYNNGTITYEGEEYYDYTSWREAINQQLAPGMGPNTADWYFSTESNSVELWKYIPDESGTLHMVYKEPGKELSSSEFYGTMIDTYHTDIDNFNRANQENGLDDYAKWNGYDANDNMATQWEIVSGEDEPNILIQALADLCWFIGGSLEKLFSLPNPPITVEYVVMNFDDTNPFHFGLGTGNPYGVIGASLYSVFRSICLTLVFVLTCYYLLKLALGAGARQRAMFKETIGTVVFMMFLMYFFPRFLNYLVSLSGTVKVFLEQAVNKYANLFTLDETTSLTEMYRSVKEFDRWNLPSAICYMAYVGSTIIFIGEYVGLSVATMLLFGIGPLIFLLATNDKNLLNKWFMTLIWNIVTPVFDSLMLCAVFAITRFTRANEFSGFVQALISLICLWNLIPARKAALSLLGGAHMGISSGIGGLAMLAGSLSAGAKGFASKLKGGSGEGGEHHSASDDISNARMADRLASEEGSMGSFSGTNRGLEFAGLGDYGSGSGNGSSMEMHGISDLVSSETASSGESYHAGQVSAVEEVGGSSSTGFSSASADAQYIESGGGYGHLGDTEIGGDSGTSYRYDAMSEGGVINSAAADKDFAGADSSLGLVDSNAIYNEGNNTRLGNLEAMDASRNNIEDLEQSIADKNAAITDMTSGTGSIAEDLKDLRDLDSAYGVIAGGAAIAASSVNNSVNNVSSEQRVNLEQQKSDAENRARQLENKMGLQNDVKYQVMNTAEKRQYIQQQIASTAAINKSVQQLRSEVGKERAQLQKAKTTYSHQQGLEREYAQRDRALGGKGTVYDSASQMRTMQNLNAIKKQNLSYKNFDTGDNLSLLSQSERADFYRERAAHETLGNIKDGAITVGVTALQAGVYAATAATLAAAGPEDSLRAADAFSDVVEGGYEALKTTVPYIAETARGVGNLGTSAVSAMANSGTSANRRTGAKRKFTDNTYKSLNLDNGPLENMHDLAKGGRKGGK